MSLKLNSVTGLSDGQGNLNISDNTEASDFHEAYSVRSPGFQIDVKFIDNSLTDNQKSIFTKAANRWSEIIVGDVSDIFDRSLGYIIDDIEIYARADFSDGVGNTLATAGPTGLRPKSLLPYRGLMQLDMADIADLEADGGLLDVIVHEMGHALGIGIIWDDLGLLDTSSISDPRFTGASATSEYNKIFGLNEASVPVEARWGRGTALGHWRETSFSNELMTGFLDAGNPLSSITVASLEDLGYVVNVSAADSYSPTGSNDVFIIQRGYANERIIGFDGIGTGTSPDAATLSEADKLLFQGEGLTARHMLLNQKDEDLVVTFEGISDVNVILQDFAIEDFDNLGQGPGTTSNWGNVIFLPQELDLTNNAFELEYIFEDVFDVFNDDWEKPHVLNKNTVTFLNALDNITSGFNESDDVINGLEGNDILNGLSGDDLLRGGDGNDTLTGSEGNDILVGGAGADRFHINISGNSIDIIQDFSIADGDVLLIDPENQLDASNLWNLSAENFTLGMSATRNSAQLIYDQSTGSLFFDADGSGALGQTHIATLSATPALSHDDIFLVG